MLRVLGFQGQVFIDFLFDVLLILVIFLIYSALGFQVLFFN